MRSDGARPLVLPKLARELLSRARPGNENSAFKKSPDKAHEAGEQDEQQTGGKAVSRVPSRQSVTYRSRPNEVVAETRCLGHQVNSLDVVPAGSWALRDAGGSRTHLDRIAAGCRAVWLQRRGISVLARNRTWSTTSAKSRAVRHTPRTLFKQPVQESNLVRQLRKLSCDPAQPRAMLSASRPGIEPGPES